MKERKIRMGTETISENILVQPLTNLKDTTPLANINFFNVSTPNVLTQITKIKQFKPFEEIKGVCTSYIIRRMGATYSTTRPRPRVSTDGTLG
jgi:hypothetical protein